MQIDANTLETPGALSYLKRFGWNTNSFLLTHAGYNWFEMDEPPALIGYVDRGRTRVVAGDPLCDQADARSVLQAFREYSGPRRRIIFVLASEWLAREARTLGFGVIPIGEDPVFDLATWSPRGKAAKKVRNPVNRARRSGVGIDTYYPNDGRDPKLEAAIADCAQAWLGARLAEPMGFLAELAPLASAEERKFFLAWHEGKLVGFLACSPIYARQAWYLEDVIRRPDAPYGVAELLITSALGRLKHDGATLATLGVAPFTAAANAGTWWRRFVLAALPFVAKPFYNFLGIRNFKKKFAPSWWETVHVVFAPDLVSVGLIYDTLNAFPPKGLRALVRDWLLHHK